MDLLHLETAVVEMTEHQPLFLMSEDAVNQYGVSQRQKSFHKLFQVCPLKLRELER